MLSHRSRRRVAAVAATVALALTTGACAGSGARGDARAVTSTPSVVTLQADPARPKETPPAPMTPTPTPTQPAPTATPVPTRTAAKPSVKATPAATPTVDKCATTYHGPPFYTSPPTAGGDGSNGRIPPSAMTAVPWAVDSHGTGFYLLTPAEQALVRLDAAFVAKFGHHLDIDLAYRDFATQVAMRDALGSVAAVPGTSKHGTGRAIDVPEWPCTYGWGTPERNWLVTHGPAYGWTTPWKTQSTDAEYWHFEYNG